MKNEVINIRVDKKTKLKLLTVSQDRGMNLSRFVLDATEKACDLDVIQVWIHTYIDYIVKNNRYNKSCVIDHYKTIEGDDAWSMPIFEDTYFTRINLLEAWQDNIGEYLPRPWEVLDKWDEFVRRLKSLGMWKEDVDE